MVDLKHFGKLPSGTQDYDKWVLSISVDEFHHSSKEKFGKRRYGVLSTVDYSYSVGGKKADMDNLEFMEMYWKVANNLTKDNKLLVSKRYINWGIINQGLPRRIIPYSEIEGELPDKLEQLFRRGAPPYFSQVNRHITLEQAKNMLRNGTLVFWVLHPEDNRQSW